MSNFIASWDDVCRALPDQYKNRCHQQLMDEVGQEYNLLLEYSFNKTDKWNAITAIIAGILITIGMIFFILAAKQVFPTGVNSISQMGLWADVIGYGGLGLGALTLVAGLVKYYHFSQQEEPINKIHTLSDANEIQKYTQHLFENEVMVVDDPEKKSITIYYSNYFPQILSYEDDAQTALEQCINNPVWVYGDKFSVSKEKIERHIERSLPSASLVCELDASLDLPTAIQTRLFEGKTLVSFEVLQAHQESYDLFPGHSLDHPSLSGPITAIALGAIFTLATIFFILAYYQILPTGLNVIHEMGVGAGVIGYGGLSLGALTLFIGIVKYTVLKERGKAIDKIHTVARPIKDEHIQTYSTLLLEGEECVVDDPRRESYFIYRYGKEQPKVIAYGPDLQDYYHKHSETMFVPLTTLQERLAQPL